MKSPATPAGQLSLFDEEPKLAPMEYGARVPSKLIPTGFHGVSYDIGFDIPVLPTSGKGAWLSDQIYRDIDTLRTGWPLNEEEADFFRKRIKQYVKSALEAHSRGE